MATVITNLLSAIPVFGHDLVELKNKLSTIGNIINNGTLDFSTNGSTAGTQIIFTGYI